MNKMIRVISSIRVQTIVFETFVILDVLGIKRK